MISAHADIVGSLLRPPDLLAAQKQLAAGNITAAEFKVIEDRAVDEAIALQESIGLEVVTDGEMRRQSFQSQMTAAVSGFGEHNLDAFLWGEWYDEQGLQRKRRPRRLGAVGELKRVRYLSVDEFSYLKSKTKRIPKITLPSPSLWANFWSPKYSREVYPTLDAFLADIVNILR
ncbi:MAG TPA: methionine synthase, partial [Candidatus Binatia bacterium]|nr:methionine synthase [Candidatus Binatia bacterium]